MLVLFVPVFSSIHYSLLPLFLKQEVIALCKLIYGEPRSSGTIAELVVR
jgi:hypothetical protein